eukprot:1141183-Prymnesium_polylepis.1
MYACDVPPGHTRLDATQQSAGPAGLKCIRYRTMILGCPARGVPSDGLFDRPHHRRARVGRRAGGRLRGCAPEAGH